MPPVNRRDRCNSKALGCGHDRCVYRAQRQVAVGVYELCHPEPITSRHRLDAEVARGEVTKKAHFGIDTQSGGHQVADLGDDQSGHKERTRVRQQEVEAGLVVPVIGIDVGVERTSVDD